MGREYNIGLDIGTNSVGWAVTDSNSDLIRYKHTNMHGSHLFNEAEKAEERRNFRSTRRRQARRKRRIKQLQMLLDNLVSEKDPAFFKRLKESNLLKEDRRDKDSSSILFNDKNYTDSTYRDEFPSIYHLRKKLVENPEKADIRLIYLAIHHIIKYRGHFLYEGQSFKPGEKEANITKDALSQIEYSTGISLSDHEDQLVKIVLRDDLTATGKTDNMKSLLPKDDQIPQIIEVFKLINGRKANLQKFGDFEADKLSFSFSDSDYEDEKKPNISSAMGDEFAIIEAAETIYKWSLLQAVLKGERYISQAMVESYNDYRQDLKDLKTLYKNYASHADKASFFNSTDPKAKNYNNYEDRGSVNNEDLIKTIKSQFANNNEALNTSEYERFKQRADLGVFLQKQRNRTNGAIPNQIHCNELEAIIDNQSQHYPELSDLKNKIISIHTFRIPYHVGPLKRGGEFAWSIKKSGNDQEIFPWNFNQVIDVDKSAEKFIENMRNFCTYLPGEEVLPKNSLLYSEFEVRNELKSVRINNTLIGIDLQNKIYDDLFKTKKTVSISALKKYLIAIGEYDKVEVSGTIKETSFASSLTSYVDFSKTIGLDPEKYKDEIEQIIKWVTLFEDKKILKRKLSELSNILSEEQQQKCLKLSYSGWGRLSKKLLTGIKDYYGTLGKVSVMDVMRQESRSHFMKVIDGVNSPFKQIIEQMQHEAWGDKDKITYSDVESLAGSPGIKRGIWRSIRIVNEIVDLMGRPPKSINIEMARNEGVKKRTKSRKKQLESIYNNYIKLAKEYNKQTAKERKKNLKDVQDSQLRSNRLFLYFLQNGRCAYTGHELDVDNLNQYDIDHIVPRSLIKNDSIDNKVLVLSSENRNKSDSYPLSSDIINRMRCTWEMWREAGLMSDAKYRALIRLKPLKESEVANFIHRQLVETSQISKHVTRMLSEQFRKSGVEIRTIRAGVPSEYRKTYNLPKSRELNDFHHAKDAYLVAVIGEFMALRYPKLDKMSLYNSYRKGQKVRTSSFNPLFIIKEMGLDKPNKETGELWDSKERNKTIERVAGYNDTLITKMSYEETGEFYGQNALKKGRARIPIDKNRPTDKYGGYSGENVAYMAAVEWTFKNKTKRQLLSVPVRVAYQIYNNNYSLIKYFEGKLGAGSNPRVLLPKILRNQKVIRNESAQYLSSAGEAGNALQLTLPLSMQRRLVPILNNTNYDREMSDEENKILDSFFDIYIDKLKTNFKMYASEAKKIEEKSDFYKNLDTKEKLYFTKQLLVLTRANATLPSIKTYGFPDGFGRKMNQVVHLDKTTFVFESITGLKRRSLDGSKLM